MLKFLVSKVIAYYVHMYSVTLCFLFSSPISDLMTAL